MCKAYTLPEMRWQDGHGKAASSASEFGWPDPIRGPWLVRVDWREIGGRMECVAFSIEEWDESEPHIITAQMMRELPIGALIQHARQSEAGASAVVSDLYFAEGDRETAAQMRLAGRQFSTPKGHGKTGRPHMYGKDHYQAVAAVYTAAWRDGESPTQAVRDAFTVSASTAARWVRECRSLGILGQTTQGKSGGILPDTKEEP